MRKFECLNDVYWMHVLIIAKGDVIIFDNVDNIHIQKENASLKLRVEDVENNTDFKEILNNLNLTIKENTEEEDDIVKPWTVQLVVNTTRKKLRLCEELLKTELNKILE